jgi:lipoyl(octanoyl) transferase
LSETVLEICWLGRLRYDDALQRQHQLVEQRRAGSIPNTLLLLEHEPVITLGRRGSQEHILLEEPDLTARGIEVRESERGGDVTLTRRDAHRYLRDLESALIDLAAHYSIVATRKEGLTGVWVGQDKLAAIGVKLFRDWITGHGFAINVGADLSGFRSIVPCGILDHGVTSLARVLRREPRLKEVAARAAVYTAHHLGLRAIPSTRPGERLALPALTAVPSSSVRKEL